jgi:hypothetical protein
VAVSCFLLFLCFRKVTQEIFSELDETKAKVPKYLTRRRTPKESRRRTRGRPHLLVAQARARPRHQGVWPPGPPPDITLSPIYSPRRENPRGPNSFLENILPCFEKEKVGRSAKLYKRAQMCQFLSTCVVWKIARTPLPVIEKNNHLSKQIFFSVL